MSTRQKKLLFLLFMVSLFMCTQAEATIMTYNGWAGNNYNVGEYYDASGDGYGSRISSSPVAYHEDTGGSDISAVFTQGNGWTPNIKVAWTPPASWDTYTGWGGHEVAQVDGSSAGNPLDVIFTPDAGYGVLINSFDLDEWAGGGGCVVDWEVLDDTVIVASGTWIGNTAGYRSTVNTGLTVGDMTIGNVVTLRFMQTGGDATYLAMDDTNFDQFAVAAEKPTKPSPANEATDVCRTPILSWTRGEYAPLANGHQVFLDDDFNEVNDELVTCIVAGVVQSETEFPTKDIGLEYNTTYYWKVNEFNVPNGDWDEGPVWQFTTEPLSYQLPSDLITATADSNGPDQGPENTINGSGLSGHLHSKDAEAMWISALGASQPNWIKYKFDKIYRLHEMWVWNHNTTLENTIGLGVKNAKIEYSSDGENYSTLGTTREFTQAPGTDGYAHNTEISFEGVAAQYVRITANSNWGGILNQYGLSEVRFFYVPVRAREPFPENEAVGVAIDVTLNWKQGREAATHEVYFSSDRQAVADGTVSPASIPAADGCVAGYAPLSLELGKTYYWKVNEVNMAEEPNTWEGDLWSFSTPEYVVVEDFEGYSDDEGDEVFATWEDGFGVSGNGSQISHNTTPWLEDANVHGGSWSAPYYFDNTGTVMNSEVKRTFGSPQNWSTAGIRALTLFFYGQAGNTTPSAGEQMYVKLNDVKVAYDGDMADITQEQWHQWDIDLALFGVNLANVTTISIGFDRGASSVSGLVYFDDIRLYSSKCVPSRRKPAGDLNNDCRFDSRDLQILTNNWLITTYEIDPQDPGTANLIGYWPLDEGTGLTTADVAPAGYANHGDLVDGAAWTTGYGGGNAISFNGEDGYVVCAERLGDSPGTYPAELMPSTFTVSCWAKLDAFSYFSSFVGNGMDYGANECGFFFFNYGYSTVNGRNFGLAIRTETEASMSYVETPSIYDTGTWYHLAASYDGQYATFYVDGAVAGGPLDVGGPMRWINDQDGNYPERFAIGVWLDPGYELWVDGTIDEVRYYSRALTHGEVGWLAGESSSYVQPLHMMLTPTNPEINAYDGDAIPIIDFKDFAALAADAWLDYQLWP